MIKGSGSVPPQTDPDLDPGGPITSGSATLALCVLFFVNATAITVDMYVLLRKERSVLNPGWPVGLKSPPHSSE
jgi:hypothetical protein